MRKNRSMHYINAATITWIALSCSQFTQAQTFSKEQCEALSRVILPGVHIDNVERVSAGKSPPDPMRPMTGASGGDRILPEHCLVQGTIGEHIGTEGKSYGIKFELRMPDNWQGRFMFQGGGGMDGFISQSIGSIPTYGSSAEPSISRGYAVVSMNGGHDGLDTGFAHDQQARLDYAYAAIGKVTAQAKYLIVHYYDEQIKHSYFMGCSNGGREAMIAAQRYPTEFDGVVAGNAGFHLSHAAIAEAWDTQALMRIAPSDKQGRPILSQALSDNDLTLLSHAVLKECDAKDGIADGIINNYSACHFNPDVLQCKPSDKSGHCLATNKVTALHKIFAGAKNSRGESLYSSWPYDSGVAAPGWRMWKLGSSPDASKPDAANITLGAGSLTEYFMTPPSPESDQ